MAYLIAKKNNMKIVETNASDKRKREDLLSFERQFKTRQLKRTLFLFDEIDGMGKKQQKHFLEIIKTSSNAIIITANDNMKVDLELKKQCKFLEVKITQMNLKQIVDRIKYIAKEEGIEKPMFDKISFDIRSSINGAFDGSQGYKKEPNNFVKTDNIFKHGLPHKLRSHLGKDETASWLLGNITTYYNGLDVYNAIKTLEVFVETQNEELLSCFPRAKRGKAQYPQYLRKRLKFHAKHNGLLH